MNDIETKDIASSTLPKLDGTVKDLINGGVWFLYEVKNADKPEVKYCLSADMMYLLKKDGSILAKCSMQPPDIVLGNRLLFSDLPKPNVNTNYSFKWGF